ncbi:hypothetical protein GGR56DRAFT_666068 [Xylariaceae sp. FL0804]|nr:hypothetical protein GGR56DRAFT_666068 [Xylariaceae sp. FL0804]
MYDDYDYRAHGERDYARRRSPASRDHHHRSRHDDSRSPRRTPSRGPHGQESYRTRRHNSPYRRDPDYSHRDAYGRERERYDGDPAHQEPSYPRRDSPGRGRARSYRDYDDPRSRSYRSPRRVDSRASSPIDSADEAYYRDGAYRSGPGRPSHTLKLDEVPEGMGAREIEAFLRDMGARDLLEVRLRVDDRDRWRCYAFAEFTSEDDAVDFLERYYPALDLDGDQGPATRIYIDYSRERRQAANAEDWKCTMCYYENFSRRMTCKQCKAPRSAENAMDLRLDGKSDECPQQTPSQFLVVRGLASSVTESTLATAMKSLYISKEEEPKQTPGQPAKLKSTAPVGNTSGLGAKPGSLVRVFLIRDKSSDISCNYGFAEYLALDDARAAVAKYNASPQFTISSKPATIAFIHSGVFIPYLHPVQEQDRRFTFSATHNASLRLVYWNPAVYASESLIYNETLYEDKQEGSDQRKGDGDQLAGKDSRKRKAEKELVPQTGKKAIAMAPQLQKWANKHAELHGSKGLTREDASTDVKTPATGPNAAGPTATSVTATHAIPTVSFADLDRMCCLLCRRKFRNEPSLRRHEQGSDMHKVNIKDGMLVDKATQELKALGKEPVSNYRDRAKERRIAHSQPGRPKTHLPKKKAAQAGREPEATQEAAAKPVVSKGAGLLAKMGWSTGEGLGVEGSGRTNIIETTAYAPGVGLGAEGGKIGDAADEAARATKNDYADFVTKAKDKARERYERMG